MYVVVGYKHDVIVSSVRSHRLVSALQQCVLQLLTTNNVLDRIAMWKYGLLVISAAV